jgi:branched-subunit amino acid transport protein
VSAWAALGIVAIVAVMTYAMRAVAIVALAEREIPTAAERVLRNVGPAVLAALAINLAAGGDGGPHLQAVEAVALVVAGVVAWWRKSVLMTLGAGMATLWVLTALV